MVTSGKPGLIRRYNRDLIRDLIQTHGPVTKVELARLSGASIPTVNKIVNQLEADGEVCRTADETGSIGRKAASYTVNKEAGYFIVFFIQNGVIKAALADYYGEILLKKSVSPAVNSPDEVNSVLLDLIDSIRSTIPAEKLTAVGLGVPGVIAPDQRIIAIPTVPCWEGYDLIPVLEAHCHVPVFLENDVKLMTIGIYRREFAERCKNMIFLYVSEGLGAGIVINGRLYKGYNNFAGEYGFMVPDFDHSVSHPDWTGDLEIKLRPLAEKKVRNCGLDPSESDLFIQILSGVITNFTAVLNPDVIAVCAPNVTESDLSEIRKLTLARIPDSCMPELLLTDVGDYGVSGVIDLCMSGIKSRISLVDETGI